MYKIVKAKGIVRIPPEYFGQPLQEVAMKVLRDEYQERVIKDIGLVLAVINAKVSEEGEIILGDGATYHEAEFEMLAFSPLIQEVVEGPIVQVTNIGAYVNLGPVDGFVHISQILDDQIHYDQIRGVLVGDKTKKSLQKGDVVRARIVSISSAGPGRMMRIALTMRQPYLGKLDWIAEEVKGMSK